MKKLCILLLILTNFQLCFAQNTKKAICISADIILVEDWSSSVSDKEEYLAQAAMALTENFILSYDGIKVGIIQFDTHATVITNCTGDNTRLSSATNYLSEQEAYGGTDISQGLKSASSLFEISKTERGKEPAYKILILISDGQTADISGAIRIADELKYNDVIIFTIQVITNIMSSAEKEGDEVLKKVATNESFHITSSYDTLYETIKKLEFCQ